MQWNKEVEGKKMKEVWYFSVMMLMLGILAGFSSLVTPTSAFVANIPPQWDFPEKDFTTDGTFELDLNDAFFDPDGDALSFSVSPSNGISAGVYNEVLLIIVEQDGEVEITASDGKVQVSQSIGIHKV